MNNPWERITAEEYEKHMKLINQHDLLNRIFKEQINENNVSEICILGIGYGNGLEHIKPNTKVYGYDINPFFLDRCRSRTLFEKGKSNIELKLYRVDLSDHKENVHSCELVICNLVLEFLDIFNFIRLVKKANPKLISIVLQVTIEKKKAISESPYTNTFRDVASIRAEINPKDLTYLLKKAGYNLKCSKTYDIDQTKYLIRLDYNKVSEENSD